MRRAGLAAVVAVAGMLASGPAAGQGLPAPTPSFGGKPAARTFGALEFRPEWVSAAPRPAQSTTSRARPKGDSLANGILIGAGVGAGAALGSTLSVCGTDDEECTLIAGYTFGAAFIPTSMAVGALVDWLIRDQPSAVVWPEWQGRRFSVGPVARVERVWAEGDKTVSAVAGIVAEARLRGPVGIQLEITEASGHTEQSGDNVYYSFTGPGTAEAPPGRSVVRWINTLSPGLGGSVALVFKTPPDRHVGVAARVGIAARRYSSEARYEIVSIAEGVDPSRFGGGLPSRYGNAMRGGLFGGLALPIRLTERLTVAPDLRLLWGGPTITGQRHQELGLGLKASVRF